MPNLPSVIERPWNKDPLSDKGRGDLGEAEATAKMMLALYLQTQYQVRVESMRGFVNISCSDSS